MCQKCIDLVKKYISHLSEEERDYILWNATAYPFSDPDYLEQQLIDLLHNTDGSYNDIMRYADKQLEKAMSDFHDSEKGSEENK